MKSFLTIMSPVHNMILICAFMASVGFGMLVAFNKRVATEREIRTIVTFGVNLPMRELTQINVREL